MLWLNYILLLLYVVIMHSSLDIVSRDTGFQFHTYMGFIWMISRIFNWRTGVPCKLNGYPLTLVLHREYIKLCSVCVCFHFRFHSGRLLLIKIFVSSSTEEKCSAAIEFVKCFCYSFVAFIALQWGTKRGLCIAWILTSDLCVLLLSFLKVISDINVVIKLSWSLMLLAVYS